VLTRTADPRPLAVSSVTPLPVLDPAAETTLQSSFAPSHRRCAATVARQTGVAAAVGHEPDAAVVAIRPAQTLLRIQHCYRDTV
jgi:hypothetical protein